MKIYTKVRNIVLIMLCLIIFIGGFININMTCTKREDGYSKLLNNRTNKNNSYEKMFNKWGDNAPIKVYPEGDAFMKIYLKNYNLVVYREVFGQMKENFERNVDSLKNSFKGKIK